MVRGTGTRIGNQILDAFIRLASEQGIDATTSRELARAAGVNEVTIFRHFGDMRTVAREALKRRMAMARFGEVELAFDVSTTETAARGVTNVLRQMRDGLRENADLLEFGMSLTARHPDLAEVVAPAPVAGRHLIRRALDRAHQHLRPQVDLDASAMTLHALLLMTVLWTRRGLLTLSDQEWDRLLAAAVRPLMNDETT